MNKIRKNDEIIMLSGKDRSKRGKVELVLTKENKIVVGGLNLVKRHLKRRSEKEPGKIVSFPKPFNAGKAMLVCPHCNLPTRVSFVANDKGEKKRVCRKCKKIIDK